MSITDKKDVYDAIVAEVKKMEKSYVLVGFQEGSLTHTQVKGTRTKEAGLSQAAIAAENEFGTSKIPARPFMSTSFDENKALINQVIDHEYDKIIAGQSKVKKSLGIIGLLMENLIQKKIVSIFVPPNSPRTISIKKSSKPLIDFGQMLSSVVSKVVIK